MEQLKKITTEEISPTLHAGREDSPELGTEGMQELFDAHPNLNTNRQNENTDIQNRNNTLFDEHMSSTKNPHEVTKTQVGLGNVDNTSDMEKPVSTAQQQALGQKADKMNTYTKSEIDVGLANKANINETASIEYVDTRDLQTLEGAKAYTDKKIVDIGAGDMAQAVYDPQRKGVDVYGYVDNSVGEHASVNDIHTSLEEKEAVAEHISNRETHVTTLTHTRNNTIHTLTPIPTVDGIYTAQFCATADYADGDTFDGYTAKPVGEDTVLADRAFVTGDLVTVVVDTVNHLFSINLKGRPIYKIMGVEIDLNNSNPATCCTYTDDAVGMTVGSADWDNFFGHYPVLFKNGAEVGKLNRNNYAQFDNGSVADISSGNAGDVMVAFPRMGLKITTIENKLKIQMTDNPNDPNFSYYAHQRGDIKKEKFYLGAYKGFELNSKLRSLSGKAPTANKTIGAFRTLAQANGAGYEQSAFYQLTYRQSMYVLKYRNLNSQIAVGRGYVDGNTSAIATGGTETKGMDWGETTGKQHMKLFGLEDFWGNIWEWIDGIVTNGTWNILTATTGFNDAGTGYTDRGKGATANISGYMRKPQGMTETGFIAKEVEGSETTSFCDSAYLYASCVAYFGGYWSHASGAGAFCLYVVNTDSSSSAHIGGRLMYL